DLVRDRATSRARGHSDFSPGRRMGGRNVTILVSNRVAGSPFTGGIFAPYVAFPEQVWERFCAEERRAALAHELAHVAEHHLLTTTLAGVVRDLFWFIPFM